MNTALNTDVAPRIINVKELFGLKLAIPTYQRPYRWSEKEVGQLLNDIIFHQHKPEYRLGTLVIHKHLDEGDRTLDIVDGQQRFLTLALIILALGKRIQNNNQGNIAVDAPIFEAISHLNINNEVTANQLSHNSLLIKQLLTQISDRELNVLSHFLLNKCTFIYIEIGDLSEAFQFFDSQNARGKSLEPYDLLKAFHLREMRNEPKSSLKQYISDWEKEAKKGGQLKNIFDNYLFRSARWIKGQSGHIFTNDDIVLFKGFNPELKPIPPYIKAHLHAHILVDEYNNHPMRKLDNQKLDYPFTIEQPILNGRRFFERIQYYIELKNRITSSPDVKPFLEIGEYTGASRKGDKFTKNLFLVSLLIFIDKFGTEKLAQAAKLCFLWAYTLRLSQQSVYFASVDNRATGPESLIQHFKLSITEKEALNYLLPLVTPLDGEKAKKIKGVISIFNANGMLSNDK